MYFNFCGIYSIMIALIIRQKHQSVFVISGFEHLIFYLMIRIFNNWAKWWIPHIYFSLTTTSSPISYLKKKKKKKKKKKNLQWVLLFTLAMIITKSTNSFNYFWMMLITILSLTKNKFRYLFIMLLKFVNHIDCDISL